MPEPGEIRKGNEIGRDNHSKYIWHTCEICEKPKWVRLVKGCAEYSICLPCSHKQHAKFGKEHNSWKGGRRKTSNGYIQIKLQPDDFFYPMANSNGYALEHRLVVAKALGRNLQPWEIVHHKHGFAKDDNHYPKTLQLVQEMQHNAITRIENLIQALREEIKELKQEIRLLRFENKELRGERITRRF